MVSNSTYLVTKRLFDVVFGIVALAILLVPMLCIAVLVKCTSRGPVVHWSKRIGKNNTLFMMAKFRTMRTDVPQMATHLLKNPLQYVTFIGSVLRRFSLDELPQLYNIVKGDLSFVGPRPALFNQFDLMELRTRKNVHCLTPGLTGWAQINGRDDLPIPVKVDLDVFYLLHRSFFFDVKIILLTLLKTVKSEGVSH
jgi:O-antigen biosynthesis protein WbqP